MCNNYEDKARSIYCLKLVILGLHRKEDHISTYYLENGEKLLKWSVLFKTVKLDLESTFVGSDFHF